MRAQVFILAIIATLSPALPAAADASIAGWPCIEDADTLNVGGRLVRGKCEGGIRVRIFGIDAPETKQQCIDGAGKTYKPARLAKKDLIALVKGKNTVTCQHHFGEFTYNRPVATCLVDGVDIARHLVRLGWARAYTHYSDRYVDEEAGARSAGRGMWAGSCEAPWDWRRKQKAKP